MRMMMVLMVSIHLEAVETLALFRPKWPCFRHTAFEHVKKYFLRWRSP